MSTLDERLRTFQQAQEELYNFFGISRKLDNHKKSKVNSLCYNHGSGNVDIPTSYPQILDYRKQPWLITESDLNSDEEIHVMLDAGGEWIPENTVRFNILSIWENEEYDSVVCAMCGHLPKPDELHYAHPDSVDRTEQGYNFYGGDRCLLILTKSIGQSEIPDYEDYTDQ